MQWRVKAFKTNISCNVSRRWYLVFSYNTHQYLCRQSCLPAHQHHTFSRKHHPERYSYHVILVQTQIVNPVPFPVHSLPKCLDEQVSCRGARKNTCMSGTVGYSANLKESQERMQFLRILGFPSDRDRAVGRQAWQWYKNQLNLRTIQEKAHRYFWNQV